MNAVTYGLCNCIGACRPVVDGGAGVCPARPAQGAHDEMVTAYHAVCGERTALADKLRVVLDQLQSLVDDADASKFHRAWIRTDDVRRILEETL